MLATVLSTEEVVPEFKEGAIFDVPDENDENDDKEIDIELSDGEDDETDNIVGYNVENAYVDEKQEAILALKELDQHTGKAFIPYLQTCYENVYKVIDHPQDDIRKASIDALTVFIIALHKQNDAKGVTNAVIILVPKLAEIIQSDEECTVVIAALESYAELLKELKHMAIASQEYRDLVFNSVSDVMNNKVACQFDEPAGGGGDDEQEESEYDEAIIEAAGNILPLFGLAMNPEQFALYFGRICPYILQKIEKTQNKEDLDSQRCFAYGALSEFFRPLQNCTVTYFESLLPVLLAGVQDKNELVRQNAVFGLGELVLFTEEKSYEKFQTILATLSNAVSSEKHPGTLDNICGALARLIITNYKLVPLEQVLPVYIQHLPLKEDYDENNAVIKSFKILFIQRVESKPPTVLGLARDRQRAHGDYS